MRTVFTIGAAMAVVLILTGCNTLGRQPRIREAGVTPEVLEPGDVAIMTVRLRDRFDVVDAIYGEIEGYEQARFEFRDDGVYPDVEAGDGIWTSDADVPPDAPPGSFTLIITAYDERGNPVEVRTEDSRQLLQTTIEFRVDAMPLDELEDPFPEQFDSELPDPTIEQ